MHQGEEEIWGVRQVIDLVICSQIEACEQYKASLVLTSEQQPRATVGSDVPFYGVVRCLTWSLRRSVLADLVDVMPSAKDMKIID